MVEKHVSDLSIGFGFIDPLEPFVGQETLSPGKLGELAWFSTLALRRASLKLPNSDRSSASFTLKDGSLQITDILIPGVMDPTGINRIITVDVADPAEISRNHTFELSLSPPTVSDQGFSDGTTYTERKVKLSDMLAVRTISVIKPIVEIIELNEAA